VSKNHINKNEIMESRKKRSGLSGFYQTWLCRIYPVLLTCLVGFHAGCARANDNPAREEGQDTETDRNDSLLLAQYLADAYCPHEVSVWTGGGLSSLNYRPYIGKTNIGTGGAFGISYTHYPAKNWGVSAGAEYALYRRTVDVENVSSSHATLDADGNPIIYRSHIDRYRERQRAGLLNIPFSVIYRTKRYYASLGFKLGVPLYGSYTGSGGTVTTSGYYTDYRQEEVWQNDLGYGSFPIKTMEAPLKLKLSYMGTVEAGMKWSTGIGTDLYAGIYMDYELNDMVRERGKNRFVEYNYENPAEPQINGLLTSLNSHSGNSRAFVEKVAPLAIGIKLKLAFSVGCGDLLAERRRYRDMQTSGYWENDAYDYPLQDIRNEQQIEQEVKKETADKAENDTVLSFPPEVIITDTVIKIAGTGVPEAGISECKCDSVLPPAISIVRYKLGQTATTPEQKSILDEYAGLLLENPQAHIEITGHTCDLGRDGLNMRIGQKRADLVRDYLVGKGIASSRISTFSRGETEPLFPNTGEENRRKNRRLEIKIRE
jgi:outer membrane protein OmpA-like peptidoglycan-associated protein